MRVYGNEFVAADCSVVDEGSSILRLSSGISAPTLALREPIWNGVAVSPAAGSYASMSPLDGNPVAKAFQRLGEAGSFDIPENACFVGIDVGEYSTKVVVAFAAEVLSQEILQDAAEPETVPGNLGEAIDILLHGRKDIILSIASNLEVGQRQGLENSLTGRLAAGESIRHRQIKSALAPAYALEDSDSFHKHDRLLLLDVGLRETRCLQIAGKRGEPTAEQALDPSPDFGGKRLDYWILSLFEDYGIIGSDEVETAFRDRDEIYQYAAKLKHELPVEGQLTINPSDFGIPKEELRLTRSELTNILVRNNKSWKIFRKSYLLNQAQNLTDSQARECLLICGGPSRLTEVADALAESLPGLDRGQVLGGDPGFAGAVGMAVYSFREYVKEVGATTADTIGRADYEAAQEQQRRSERTRPGGQYFLRMHDVLQPIFSDSERREEISCAPMPTFLATDNVAPVELQLFREEPTQDARAAGWPEFISRQTIEVPAGQRFRVILELTRARSGDLIEVAVETGDDRIVGESWRAPETLEVSQS